MVTIFAFFVYFDFQTKVCCEGIKRISTFGENDLGFVKRRFIKPSDEQIKKNQSSEKGQILFHNKFSFIVVCTDNKKSKNKTKKKLMTHGTT